MASAARVAGDGLSVPRAFCVPNVVLKATLNARPGLKICHFNSRSLSSSKIDEVRLVLSGVKVQVICVSETWWKDTTNVLTVTLPNFNIIRNDRVDQDKSRGGGVGIYLHSKFKSKVVYQSSPNASVESLFIEVHFDGILYLIGVIYISPASGSNCFGELEDLLNFITPKYENIIITGDFNFNVLPTCASSTSLRFKSIIDSFSLNIHNSEPTHFTATTSTLLDLLVTNLNSISFFNQISLPGITDHDMIFFCGVDVDDKVKLFNLLIRDSFNKYVPVRFIRVCKDKPLWFGPVVCVAMFDRDCALPSSLKAYQDFGLSFTVQKIP